MWVQTYISFWLFALRERLTAHKGNAVQDRHKLVTYFMIDKNNNNNMTFNITQST